MKFSIELLFLLAFVYLCYRDLRIDLFREELFIVRSELFEYAASGAVPFDDPAYRLLVNFLNDIIRYAHALTFSRFIIASSLRTIYSYDQRNTIEEWRQAVAKIESEEVRSRLNEFHNRAAQSILGQMIRRSIFLYSFVLVLRSINWVLGSGQEPQDLIKEDALEEFESQVLEVEKQDAGSELVTA
jgi:hypothetical protein